LICDLADAAADAYSKPDEYTPLEDDLGLCRGFMRFGYGPLISIRGTASIRDAFIDGDVLMTETASGDGIHTGFLREFEAIQHQVFRFVRTHPMRPIHLTGHSLGGAIATILAAELAKDGYEVSLTTFGSPRVGNSAFAETFEALKIDHVRVVHADDIVPRMPKIGYRHVSPALHLNSDGKEIGPIGGLFRWLIFADKILTSDLSGKSFTDHKMIAYLLAVTRYAELQRRKGTVQ